MKPFIYRWTGYLALSLSLAAVAQQAAPPARAGFRISGTVVNAIGGQVLAQVTVTISRADNPDETRQTTSDDQGHFAPPRALAERIYVPLIECLTAKVEVTCS